jgi:hemolysin activation/secretion protein
MFFRATVHHFFSPRGLKGLPAACRIGWAIGLAVAASGAPAPSANPAIHFEVKSYEVTGNTLLPQKVINDIFSQHTGTNVTFDDVARAEKELQLQYHNRGYDTVSVTIPQQRLTNGVFRVRVFEGRLAEIVVMGNRFFSSNDVMRALSGLKTNVFLNSKLLQPQLDLANGNRDRQIYPEIHPGPTTNTTTLILRIKDQLPLHAKVEANNQSTPGTPDMRLATSAEYDNLWQLEHSMGMQYTFSEEQYKQGGNWNMYDKPLVANYSGFYRMPLAAPQSPADEAANNPGKFGYNEATRKFVLPPSIGAPELNIYGSGSTIDTGVVQGAQKTLFSTNTGIIQQQTLHQDLTYNDALGFRVTSPLPEFYGFRSHVQFGGDYKQYKQENFETNDFIFTQFLTTASGQPFTRVTTTPSPVPTAMQAVDYFPLTLHYDVDRPDPYGSSGLGANYSPNIWYSGSRSNLENVAGSTEASGFWHVVTGYVNRDQNLPHDWKLALRGDGQWSSEPLISNEQFGAGGINGVRGYHEGEVFGDSGWRVTSELKLPPYRVGYAGQGTGRPLIVRASFFMDYADTYLSDPGGRKGETPLWGTGIAGAASLGSHFNGMLSFGLPLQNTPTTEAYHLRIAFSLSAQF